MYLIDGYNLLFKRPDIVNEVDLIFALSEFANCYNKKIIVVFDGERNYKNEFDNYLFCVEYMQDADERLIELISKYPKSIVVSSDNQIKQFANSNGCKTILSENFDFSLIQDSQEKPSLNTINNYEIEEMLKLFGDKNSL